MVEVFAGKTYIFKFVKKRKGNLLRKYLEKIENIK